MATSVVRTIFLYLVIMVVLRIMGKRQVGQLQPSELVIMILISELISIPMQDMGIPLLHGVIPVLILASLELIVSGLSLKFPAVRSVLSGKCIPLIENGKPIQKNLWKTRMSIDDLMEELRLKDVHDIREVKYAQMEINGQLSILLDPKKRPATPEDLRVSPSKTGFFTLFISDGTVIKENLGIAGHNASWVKSTLQKHSLSSPEQVFWLLADEFENIILVRKEEKK